jgi:aldose 1-epimerase
MITQQTQFSTNEINNISYTELVIKNEITGEFFSVVPEYGGRLKELWLHNGERNVSLLRRIPRIDSTEREDLFTNAKLSPFAGRIKNGKYELEGEQYALPLNYPEEQNACHGFLFGKKFNNAEKKTGPEDTSCTLQYIYDREVQGYPYTYLIELTYTLNSSHEVICQTRVENYSDSAMPLSDGWHPCFALNERINDLQLKLQVNELIELDDSLIPTGKRTAFDEFRTLALLGERQLDSCFLVREEAGRAVTQLYSGRQKIDLRIWQEAGLNQYKYLVVYTPPDRNFIAIEPMTANVNAFNNKDDLIMLPPKAIFTAKFGIRLNS